MHWSRKEGEQYAGIDVSRYQGDVDFNKLKESGVEIVYIRAGEGADYEDPYFRENAKKAKKLAFIMVFICL